MRVCVLTTPTLHHAHFVRALASEEPGVVGVLLETGQRPPPFQTSHPFEADREADEASAWFEGRRPEIQEFAPTATFEDLNSPEAVAHLEGLRPDLVFVFGTGRLRPAVLGVCPEGLINLHGGDPEEYRGLDTHLWAIYHRDFAGLVTTLHRVAPRLDTGDLILQAPIPVPGGATLAQLRRHNTEVCIDLARAASSQFARLGYLLARPQRRLGRYYSSMPASLKAVCVDRFERWAARR